MATKKITLTVEAYEKLRAERRHPGESLSSVVLRGIWPEPRGSITGRELLRLLRSRKSLLNEAEVQEIESLTRSEDPPEDKWRTQ